MTQILLVGNYCHDTLIHLQQPPSYALGGSVAYISAILDPLNLDYEVISKVGKDFKYLSQVTKRPQVIETARTTAFIDDFTEGDRKGRVECQCEPIFPEEIQVRAEVALVGGIAGEISPATLEAICRTSKRVLCDAQSLVRQIQPNGEVVHRCLEGSGFLPLLSQIEYLKVSEQEAEVMDLQQIRQKTRILLTRGEKGFTLLEKDSQHDFPAVQVESIDPTGAGDCFLAGFALGLLLDRSLQECAQLATLCGALAVQSVGIPFKRSILLKSFLGSN
jgi:1D-myo-inositol 3-kinase